MSAITPQNYKYVFNCIRSRIQQDGLEEKYVRMIDVLEKDFDLAYKTTTKQCIPCHDNADHCVCCGAIVPEGREICPICQERREYNLFT